MLTSFRAYKIEGVIGAGAMGRVYKAVHTTLGYPVAIKTLRSEWAEDESYTRRFEREAMAAAAVRSHNIVKVIDFGVEEDTYCIVMEYVEGRDLRAIFDELQKSSDRPRPFPTEIVLALLEEIAYGLKAAHAQGIIHRDIKPSNILLDREGVVKVADFGLARELGDLARLSSRELTRPGAVVGTLSYMSPEQAAGSKIDHRSDIFSLGVVAYSFLTATKPFTGRTDSETLEKIQKIPAPPLTLANCPLLTPEIGSLVDKMLAKNPDERFQSMAEVLEALALCVASMEKLGGLARSRRAYLVHFANKPVTCTDELRERNIQVHLELGTRSKDQGDEGRADALRHFQYVLALDPGHKQAASEVRELAKTLPSSVPAPAGGSEIQDGSGGQTEILSTPGSGNGSDAPPTVSDGLPRRDGARKARRMPPKIWRAVTLCALLVTATVVVLLAVHNGNRGSETLPSPEPTASQRQEQRTGEADVSDIAATPARPSPAPQPGADHQVSGQAAAEPPRTTSPGATHQAAGPLAGNEPGAGSTGRPADVAERHPAPDATASPSGPPISPAYASTVEPAGAAPSADRPSSMTATPTPGAGVVTESRLTPAEGQVTIQVEPPEARFVVFVNGTQRMEASGSATLTLPANEAQLIEIKNLELYGMMSLGSVTLQPEETRALGPYRFGAGVVTIAALYPFTAGIGDWLLPGAPAKKYSTVRVLEGDHDLVMTCAGHEIRGVIGDDNERLVSLASPDGRHHYRLTVRAGQTLNLYVDLQ